jgi:hypothetical protein
MSPEEARWFGNVLGATDGAALSPVLNLGSSTLEYRTVTCPHIDSSMFRPLAERGVRVFHADMKEGVGIDVVGSVLDEHTRRTLVGLGVRTVLCNNLLEHVTDIDALCSALAAVCPEDGLLLISVPHAYPFHPDPIDNAFRPSVAELAELLRPHGFELRSGELVTFGSYGRTLLRKRRLIARDAYLLLAGLFDPTKWRVLFSNYRFLIRPYDVACAVFVRRAA